MGTDGHQPGSPGAALSGGRPVSAIFSSTARELNVAGKTSASTAYRWPPTRSRMYVSRVIWPRSAEVGVSKPLSTLTAVMCA